MNQNSALFWLRLNPVYKLASLKEKRHLSLNELVEIHRRAWPVSSHICYVYDRIVAFPVRTILQRISSKIE